MPKCGTQILLCDVPVRFDTYKGCSHGCRYCFTQLRGKYDNERIRPHESAKALRTWIQGGRTQDTAWADWSIPLHWGGMSDPFQPCEAKLGHSLACLELLAETHYPVIVSTKGALIDDPRYRALLVKCNAVLQISAVCPTAWRQWEPGACSYDRRLDLAASYVGRVHRVMVRVQPYLPIFKREILGAIERMSRSGIHGIVVEGLKSPRRRPPCTEMVGSDWCVAKDVLARDFKEIKAECRRAGLAFYVGENRLRNLGDDLCCCGVAGLPGWRVNTANCNHLLFDPDGVVWTPAMEEPGSGYVFGSIPQDTEFSRRLRNGRCFRDIMAAVSHTATTEKIYGV